MRFVVLPGMGATSSMYAGEWRRLEGAHFVDWPTYAGETTLRDVARRIIAEHSIHEVDIPVGSSLGGMVALEIAAQCHCDAVALFGSAVSLNEVNGFVRALAPIANVAPVRLAQLVAGITSVPVLRQFARSDPQFIKAMCIAAAKWEGVDFRGPVLRVHGVHDHIISKPKDAIMVDNAGHLLPVTHPGECVELLKSFTSGILK